LSAVWDLSGLFFVWLEMNWIYAVRVNDTQEKQIEVVSVHETAINKHESHENSHDSSDNKHVLFLS
jgi:hypothetical protein